MDNRKIRDATDKVLMDEANTLAALLSNEERCCMVHVTVAYHGEEEKIRHGHGVAGRTTGTSLRQFIMATERHLKWLQDKLHRRA